MNTDAETGLERAMKLLISDLDGTLYPRKESLNPHQREENFKAVKRWVDRGHQFAVATARGLHHYPAIREALGFDVHFIGGNGAAVRLVNGETIIKQLPCSVYIDLCRFVRDQDLNVSVTTGYHNQWIWSHNDRYPRGVAAYDGIWDSIEIANLEEMNPEDGVERIQIFVPPHQRDAFRETLAQRNYPGIITTSDQDMIDIGPLNSSKGISISELCQRYNIGQDDLIVVGDSENDIPMFKTTPHSYCIDLAEPRVIESASHSVASVQELIDNLLEEELPEFSFSGQSAE